MLLLIVGITLAVQPFHGDKTRNVLSDDVVTSGGTVYYVNAETDSDKYDGTSEKTPLKTLEQVNALTLEPGDRVLFKKDCAWYGEVIIKSSGTEEAPIVYGMYGEGENKPAIHGEGLVHAVVSGEDVSHVEVRNLEITNDDDNKIGNTLQFRRGISFVAAYQSLEGITIRECYVHHVDSNETGPKGTNREFSDEHWYGGIIVRGKSMKNMDDKTITLKDTLIENNVVDSCALVGIVMGHYEGGEKGTGTVIRGNYVSNCLGDGIILFNDKEGLIEYNVSDSNGERGKTDVASAGIWVIFCDDTIMQYNEAFETGMSGDGQGFDIDGSCSGTIFQYNYSHDNYGGMLLLMQNFGHDAIIRYNVSVNDGGGLLNIAVGGGAAGQTDFHIDVYNNTYFTTDPIDSVIYFRGDMNRKARIYGHFRNNIFCVRNGTSATFATGADLEDLRFENNCYYGFLEGTLPEYEDGRIIANPKFAAIGTEGKGIDTLKGYQLLADSPCLGSGMDIYNNGGLDYWGNKINEDLINIGAYAGEAVERPESFNAALAQTTSLEEREVLLRNTLNGLYSNAAALYEANNKTTIAYNNSQANLNVALSKAAAYVTPLITALNNLGTTFLTYMGPAIRTVAIYLTAFIQLIAEAIVWVSNFFGLFSSDASKATADVEGYQAAMSNYLAELQGGFVSLAAARQRGSPRATFGQQGKQS